jgi:branched-chain amino acid transport system substrate-binding protein
LIEANLFFGVSMKFTGSRALTVVSVAVAAMVLAACGKKEVVSTEMVVKIGHVGPVSGAIAHLGKDNENGARMAIEELNAAGLKIGDKTA